MFWPLLVLAAMALLTGAHVASAMEAGERSMQLCADASETMLSDPLLRNAMKAAYPNVPERRADQKPAGAEGCVYPYQAILYENAAVLLTLGQKPGDACHGCPAKISAVFLKREKDRLTPVARHRDFAESGTWGDLNGITPVRWGSDDGIVIEGAGTFQGETSSLVQAFIFRNGRAQAISPGKGILLSRSNCDTADSTEACTDIGGAWRVDPAGRMLIEYGGKSEDGKTIETTVIYERQGDALVLISGTPPSF